MCALNVQISVLMQVLTDSHYETSDFEHQIYLKNELISHGSRAGDIPFINKNDGSILFFIDCRRHNNNNAAEQDSSALTMRLDWQ